MLGSRGLLGGVYAQSTQGRICEEKMQRSPSTGLVERKIKTSYRKAFEGDKYFKRKGVDLAVACVADGGEGHARRS